MNRAPVDLPNSVIALRICRGVGSIVQRDGCVILGLQAVAAYERDDRWLNAAYAIVQVYHISNLAVGVAARRIILQALTGRR